MSGKLRMYNVEFGDAFLLYGQGENLLVDLGSIGQFTFDQIRDSIRSECADQKFSLLLTHFHRDHWSGLHNQPETHPLPPIRRIYLPDIFQMRVYGKLDVIIRSLLGDFLQSVVLRTKPRFTLADLLREVLPELPREQICLLSRGDVFQMGGRNYEVLWPCLNQEYVVWKRNKWLLEFLDRTENKLAADRAESGLWDTIEAIANILLRDFANSLDYRLPAMIQAEERSYSDLYRQAQRLSELLARELETDDGEYLNKARRYGKKLSRDWNQVSLVFQEQRAGEESQAGILMTGDVTKEILRRLVDGKFGAPGIQERYAVIKAPHHGTNSHFCPILPPSRHFCISNGEGNEGFHSIAEDYEHVYGCLGKHAEIHCTNPRCEFRDRKGACPYFDRYPVEYFYDIVW